MRLTTQTAEPAETRVVLDNVSWTTFETLLDETGPRRGGWPTRKNRDHVPIA